jgi:hypothetical protein
VNAARNIIIVSVAIAAATIGCSSRTVVHTKRSPDVVVVKETKGGPPPHAPAHGYRKKHGKDNVVLKYDAGIAVYVVKGHRDCYFNDGVYFRLSGSTWETSARIDGPWKVAVVDRDLPDGLKKKYKIKYKPDSKQSSHKAK